MASKSLDLLLQPVWFGLRANFRTPVRKPGRPHHPACPTARLGTDMRRWTPPTNPWLTLRGTISSAGLFFHQRERRNAA